MFSGKPLEATSTIYFSEKETLHTLEEKLTLARREGVPSNARISTNGGLYSPGWLNLTWAVKDTIR